MKSIRLPLAQKIFIILLLVALIPFTLTNLYWYTTARDTATNTAKNSLVTITLQSRDSVNNFLNTKLLGFLSHSQGASLLSGQETLIQSDLANFLLQDPDIISLTFVDKTGQEIVKVTKNNIVDKTMLLNIANKPEFKVPAFKFGEEYIGPVAFSGKEGIFKISVPVVYPENSQSLLTFSSSKQSPRSPGEVFGVLIGEISISHLQESMSAIHIGKNGYISIIDSTGNIIVDNDKSLIGRNVKNQLSSDLQSAISPLKITDNITPVPIASTNFSNTQVLSSYLTVPRNKWLVLAEQPQSEISSDIADIQNKALLLFIAPFLIIIGISFIFSNSLTRPIKQLVIAASQIGKGNFDFPFTIRTGDEMERLGNSYHKMAEQLKADRLSLMRERNTLSTVLGSTADGVLGLNKDGIVMFANAASTTILNKNITDIINKPFDSLFPLADSQTPISIIKICQRNEHVSDKFQLMINNQQKTIHLIATAIPTTIDSSIRYILTIYDISKEQELEDMKVDFISMAAHELRTPLTSMKGYFSMFTSMSKDMFTEDQKEMLRRIDESTKRLGALVENILKVTRIEKTGLVLDYKATDWKAFIQRTIEDIKTSADAKKIAIHYTIPTVAIPQILVDQERISEVVSNFLTNAIKYTPEGGEITVLFTYNEQEQSIVTYIKDNGQGIPKDSIPHLFTKFYRVPGKLEQTIQGTGLGLYISKQIIDLHHGKVWVTSEVGKGTTMTFSLPLHPNLAQPAKV